MHIVQETAAVKGFVVPQPELADGFSVKVTDLSTPFEKANVAASGTGTSKSNRSLAACPCCGSQLKNQRMRVDLDSNTFLFGDRFVHMAPMKAELLNILADAYPRVCSFDFLTSALWGSSEPETAYATLKVHINQLRNILKNAELPVRIPFAASRGYRLSVEN